MSISITKRAGFFQKKVSLLCSRSFSWKAKWAFFLVVWASCFYNQAAAQCTATVTSVTGATIGPPGGPVTLNAAGTGSLHWYDALTEGNRVNIGPTYNPTISATTNFYVESVVLTGSASAVPIAPTNTFTGNTRGYWFTSPADILITSVYVPTDASTGNQSIAVVRFNGAVQPPIYTNTTDAFTTLFLTQDNPESGPIPVEIVIHAGEVIGFLGSRNDINSYAPGGTPITIAGTPVTLTRLGMQFHLRTTMPQELFTELGGSISRVIFDYSPVCFSTPRTQVTATLDCTPQVQITANPSGAVIENTSVTFTATPTNAGSSPTYQWKKNGSNVGTNSTTYTDNMLITGDKITCVISSNETCALPNNTATSNEITMTVNPLCTTPTAYNVTGGGTFCNGGSGVAIGLEDSETGVNYQLKNGTTSVGSPVAGNGNAISFAPQTATGTYTVEAAAAIGNCTATMAGNAVVAADNQAPTITCPANISVFNTLGQCGAVVTYTAPVGTDNCPGATTVRTTGLASGATFPVGVTTNTFRVTASNGQTTECSFTVTVTDNELPTIVCPANISVNNQPNQCGAVVNFPAVVGTDNCPGATTTVSIPSGSFFPVGITPVTYTVTAANGQTATCVFTVTVTDNELPLISCPTNLTACQGSPVTFTAPVGADNCSGATTTQTTGLPSGSVYPVGVTTNTFQVTAANGQTATCSFSVTVYPRPTATISGTASICQNAPATVTFTANGGTAPYSFTYQVNGGSSQTLTTVSGNSATVNPSTANAGVFVYTLLSVSDAHCSQNQSGTTTLTIQAKAAITLNVLGQTLNEGNNPVLCDTDANPANALAFNVTTGCVSGAVQWRTQIGAGVWSAWSVAVPTAQPSDNTAYRYQAACDINCPTTFTNPIELTINYRASTPQNVSLVADGTNVAPGESKTICDVAGNTITFNATCAAGEIVLYSVDGGDYSATAPTQIVDGNFHNYRVRCRKANNAPSCVETESGVMSLKITTAPSTPTATISPLSSCQSAVPFSGNSTCAADVTLWYNAANDQLLSTLPTTTPTATTPFYVRCRNEAGCLSEKSNSVTFTFTPVNNPPEITVSSESVCTGTQVTVSANCPEGATTVWNTGLTQNSFQVTVNTASRQTYSAKCVFPNGCQSPVSASKEVIWKSFDLTVINIGQSQSGIKPANDRNLWSSQFVTPDTGPSLEKSTQLSPTVYYTENLNKGAPRYWTIQVETCALGTDGSVTYDLLATPETGVAQSFNTHENNAPYLMYANREGWTELYAQNHPAYGFYQSNGSGGNTYDMGLPKGLYKLGIRYWDQKGQGSIYPSTRQPAGNVLAYQEYWFRIQSQNGIGTGVAREAFDNEQLSDRRTAVFNTQWAQVMPNPVSNTLHLKVDKAKDQKVNVNLLDASGRTLSQCAFVPETDQHQEEFEVSNLVTGIYFLKVNTTEKQATLKVIKVQ